jgi:Tfp pilus assembly protein PilF
VPPPDLVQYSEARLAEEGFGMAPLASVRHAGFKRIRAPRPELYDLRRDPGETRDVGADDPERARALDAELDAILADSARRALVAPTRPIDRETEEMLRALGYLAAPEQRAEMAGMDPKDGMALYARIEEARGRAQMEDWAGATALLRDVVATAPANVTARNILGLAAVKQGRLDDAEQEYRASLAQQPRQHRVLAALGALALQRGRLDDAERDYRAALDLAPGFFEAMATLGFLDAERGDDAGAEAWYRKALAADPTYPHAYRRLADLFYDRKDYRRALGYYDQALATLPRDFVALIQAGNSARFAGDGAAAAARYLEARRVRPDSWIPPYNLACLRALDGRADSALALLHDALDAGLADADLLEQNEDFATLRGRPDWDAVVSDTRRAAERRNAAGPATADAVGSASSSERRTP